MGNDVVLIHRQSSNGFEFAENADLNDWFLWQTCLRKIALGFESSLATLKLKTGDEILRGHQAYQFCLQVVCGLHSPLIGETEVYGQFKEAVGRFQIPSSPAGLEMRRFFQSIFTDAKKVREAHLKDLGSQSYGSILRREIKSLKEIHFLGAGHLVQEILPWIYKNGICKDGIRVHVHCRNPEKAQQDLGKFPQVQIHSLSEDLTHSSAEAFVIAAPVSASWIQSWLKPTVASLKYVADLRAESPEDKLELSDRACLRDLPEFMNRISVNQDLALLRKQEALHEIAQLASARQRRVEYRPFGWEDVCA